MDSFSVALLWIALPTILVMCNKTRRWDAMSLARVQARGQVTIPQDIREACGVEPGTDLMFVKTGPTTFECWVLPTPLSLREIFDKYSVEGVAPDIEQLLEEM